MANLQIDGIGSVTIDDAFLSLPPEKQAAEVDAIAATIRAQKGQQAPPPEYPPGSEEAEFLRQANAAGPAPDTAKARGSILPLARDESGNLTLALPQALEEARKTVVDLLDGRRTPDQITGKEMFNLGLLFGGAPSGAAAGTGAGVARAAAERAAVPVAERAATPAAEASVAATAKPHAPVPQTTDELKAAAKGFYRQADEAGVVLAPDSYKPLVQGIVQKASREGLDKDLTPDSVAAIRRLAEVVDKPVSFETLDTLRQVAGVAAGAQRPKDRMIAQGIIEQIDDYVAGLAAKDIISGDAKQAATAIVQARDLWSKASKLEMVERLVDRAKSSAPNFSASGMENALRTEFRSLAKNAKEMRKLTAQEQAAVKKVARGTVPSRAARNVGRFAPTGPVSAGLGLPTLAGIGASFGGPVGAAVLTGAGAATAFGARRLAQAMIQRQIRDLEDLIRTGGDSAMAKAAIGRANSKLQLLAGPAEAALTDQSRK